MSCAFFSCAVVVRLKFHVSHDRLMDERIFLAQGILIVSAISVLLLISFYKNYSKRERLNKLKTSSEVVKANYPVNVEVKDQSLYKISDLHLLKKVSDEQLALLYEEKIYNIEDLRERIISRQDAVAYSKKLGIYKSLVEDWVRLGEFSILQGITQEYIDLFEMNGIKTITDLVDQDPEILYNKLKHKTDSTNSVPTLGMINHWIRVSKSAQEKDNLQIIIIK